jgi:hypothetical protein
MPLAGPYVSDQVVSNIYLVTQYTHVSYKSILNMKPIGNSIDGESLRLRDIYRSKFCLS